MLIKSHFQSLVILLLSLSIALLAPIARASTDDEQTVDEQRRELAQIGKRMLEMTRDDIADTDRKINSRLDELLEALGAHESEQEAVALLREVFAQYEPEGLTLLDGEMAGRPMADTKSRLNSLQTVLEVFRSDTGRYPSASEGLLVLMAGGEQGTPYIAQYEATDGWGRVFLYQVNDADSYELRSSGPDGEAGTSDDLTLGTPIDTSQNASYKLDLLATLAEGDVLDGIDLAPGGRGVAYRLVRGDQKVIVVNGKAQQAYEQASIPRFSPAGNVVMYTAKTGTQDYIVANGIRHKIAEPLFSGCRFVEGTDIFGTPVRSEQAGSAWQIGNGEWLASTTDRYGDHRVSNLVFDEENRCLAVRVRHGKAWFVHDKGKTSEGHAWVSRPKVLPGGGAVTYRTWSPEETCVFMDGKLVGVHQWARGPVFNANGSRFAYGISVGGKPSPQFRQVREYDPDISSMWLLADEPGYQGGTYHIVFNGEVGPAFAFVRDPIFNPSGTNIAYAAKLKDGRWVVVHDGEQSAPYQSVSLITFDRAGSEIAFVGNRDEKSYVVVDGKASAAHEGIPDLVGGAPGTFAFIETNSEGKQQLTSGWSRFGPFDRVRSLGFLPDGKTVCARLKNGDQEGVLIGGKIERWFDFVLPILTTAEHTTPVYAARSGKDWHVARGNSIGPAFAAVGRPEILDDGRVLYVGSLGGNVQQNRFGYPRWYGGTQHVVVDGKLGEACRLSDKLTVSPDRLRAFYQADFEDGGSRTIEVGRKTYRPQDGSSEFAMFDNKSRLILLEKGENYTRFVIDNVTQPAFDAIYIERIRSTPAPFTYTGEEGGKSAFVVGSWISPHYKELDDPIFSPEGTTLACRGSDGDGWHLIVGEWSGEKFDEVFAPKFSEDGESVLCVVRRGRELLALSVKLSEISG